MKFRFSDGFCIDTSEEPWRSEGLRLGLFANPGAGKSYTTAILVEQWLDQGGTVVIFEPRSEWHTLKQRYPIQVVGGPFLQDVPLVDSEPTLYASVVVEQGVSMIFYTGDIDDEEKLVAFVTSFIHRILRLQEQHHRPLLLVLEETQEYAPRSPSGHIAPPWVYNRMIKALKDCFTQGRKLNVCPVAISQRPQEVNFTIRQLANLAWFGGFSAQDVKYLDTEVFAPFRKNGVEVTAGDLLGVPRGEWLVIVGRTTHRVKVTEKRKTPHGADTPKLEYVQPVGEDIQKAISGLGEQLKIMLDKRAAEESELEKAKRKIRDLTDKTEDLERKVKLRFDLKELVKGSYDLSGHDPREISDLEDKIVLLSNDVISWRTAAEENAKHLGLANDSMEALRKENDRLIDSASKYGALEELIKAIVEPLIPKPQASIDESVIDIIIDRKFRQLTPGQRKAASSGETAFPWVNVWLPKLGSAERKIILKLAEKYPLQLTKSQIALSVGLTASGGHFTEALNNLSKWHLVSRQGEEYKLAEAPA